MNPIPASQGTTIPQFQFQLSDKQPNNGLISVGNETIHCISDTDSFFNALGFTKEVKETGMCFEDYIWCEYKKYNSSKPDACLQARIFEYLIKFSPAFMEKYGQIYESCIGNCNEIIRYYDDCTQCIMHPNQNDNASYDFVKTGEVNFYATRF